MTGRVERAVADLARTVLAAADGGSATGRWSSPREAEAAVEAVLGAPSGAATAFGRSLSWPVWETAAGLVAPGLPVAVSREPRDGPGGGYRRDGAVVRREAAGRERPLLDLESPAVEAGETAFELLWFHGEERCRVAGGWLELEDLFAVTRLPATTERMAAASAGRVGHGPSSPAWPVSPPARGAPTLEVGRPAGLFADRRWGDPAAALAARAGVHAVRRPAPDVVEAVLEDERVIRLSLAETAGGWRLERVDGRDPYAAVEIAGEASRVALRAEPVGGVDLGRVEVRRRVAFDLQAWLVSLATG